MRRRSVLASASVLVGSAMAGCLTAAPAPFEAVSPDPGTWPYPQYDSHNTSYNPHATPPAENPDVRWERLNYGEIRGGLAAEDALIAFGESGIWSFAPGDGEERWSHAGDTYSAGILDQRVYACGWDLDAEPTLSWIRSIDIRSGDVAWTWEDDGNDRWLRRAMPAGAYLIVGDRRNSETLVFEREHGDLIWTVDPGGGVALADERLLVTGRGSIATFSIDAGWVSNELERVVSVETISDTGPDSPVYHPYRILRGEVSVFPGGRNASVHAYGRDSGQKHWTSEPRGVQTSAPALVDDVAFAAQTDGNPPSTVVSVNFADGGQRWQATVEAACRRVIATDELVLVPGERAGNRTGLLVAFDHGGERLWDVVFNGPPGGVIAVEDRLFVGTLRGEVVSLGPA